MKIATEIPKLNYWNWNSALPCGELFSSLLNYGTWETNEQRTRILGEYFTKVIAMPPNEVSNIGSKMTRVVRQRIVPELLMDAGLIKDAEAALAMQAIPESFIYNASLKWKSIDGKFAQPSQLCIQVLAYCMQCKIGQTVKSLSQICREMGQESHPPYRFIGHDYTRFERYVDILFDGILFP